MDVDAILNRVLYKVFLEYDGVADECPLFRGDKDACCAYMRRHWKAWTRTPHLFPLLVAPNGRAESFVL